AADAAEIISLRREEQPLDRLLGRFLVGCVAGTEQRIDLLERLVLALGRVLRERVLDERALGAAARDEAVRLVQAVLAEALEEHLLERLAGLADHFARLRIDRVDGQHAGMRAFAALDGVELIA